MATERMHFVPTPGNLPFQWALVVLREGSEKDPMREQVVRLPTARTAVKAGFPQPREGPLRTSSVLPPLPLPSRRLRAPQTAQEMLGAFRATPKKGSVVSG